MTGKIRTCALEICHFSATLVSSDTSLRRRRDKSHLCEAQLENSVSFLSQVLVSTK